MYPRTLAALHLPPTDIGINILLHSSSIRHKTQQLMYPRGSFIETQAHSKSLDRILFWWQ